MTTTKLSNTPDVLARIRPQVIHALVDESLQIQEALKNDIKISDADVVQGIATIEAQRGMPSGGIADMLKENNIPAKTFENQVRAQLAWNKLIAKRIRPSLRISEEEVALGQQRIANATAINTAREVQISVIALPVEKPKNEAEIKKLAEKLAGELHKGAHFEEIARQFSTGGSEAFWIRPEQLDPIIGQALSKTEEGAITAPLRTGTGFSIVKLLKIRAAEPQAAESDTEVNLKEILLKLKPDAGHKEADVLLQIGEEVAKHPGTCEEKGIANIQDLDAFDINVNFRVTPMSELPQGLRTITESLALNDISAPFASEEGIRLYMLCGKKEITSKAPSADRVREALFRQKYELEVQKYLRNIRREAYIEIRQY